MKIRSFKWWHMPFLFCLGWQVGWNIFTNMALSTCVGYGGWIGWRLVGVGGVHRCWRGVGEAFIFLTEEALQRPILVAYACRNLDILAAELHLRRLQCSVRCDQDRACELVEWLGFQYECVLLHYDPMDGADHYLAVKYYG